MRPLTPSSITCWRWNISVRVMIARAVECFEKLFTLAPNYPPAYHMAGRTFQRLGRISEARATLQKGIPLALSIGNSHAAGEMQELLDNLE